VGGIYRENDIYYQQVDFSPLVLAWSVLLESGGGNEPSLLERFELG
jgi:hypothetical protein